MSRSYKKFAGWTDYSRSWTKWSKRQASKSVRNSKWNLANGSSYKKIYNSYDIRDYVFVFYSKKECESWFKNEDHSKKKVRRAYAK